MYLQCYMVFWMIIRIEESIAGKKSELAFFKLQSPQEFLKFSYTVKFQKEFSFQASTGLVFSLSPLGKQWINFVFRAQENVKNKSKTSQWCHGIDAHSGNDIEWISMNYNEFLGLQNNRTTTWHSKVKQDRQ